MSENVITSYKGFDKNMECRGFQYEVGREYEMDEEIGYYNRGFHACKSPLGMWGYCDMLNSRFAEVEQSGKIDENEKSTGIYSSRIKINTELKLSDIIIIGVEWLKDITSPSILNKNGSLSDNGDGRKQIGVSDSYVKIGVSGDFAEIGSSGHFTNISSSGVNTKIGSLGGFARISVSGCFAQIGSLGCCARISSSGDCTQISSSGRCSQISSSGNEAKIDSTGEDSVIMCTGSKSKAKAKVGSWITLAEWKWNDEKKRDVPVCVKTEYVDGENIKADTWYQLKNGKFVEVEK